MHQIGSGMYVSGPAPDKKKERRLSSGSVATPPYTGGDVSRSGELGRMFDIAASPASSHRSTGRPYSGPLSRPSPASGPLSQLSHSGLLVGPSPSPASASWRTASRRRAGGEAAAVVAHGRVRLGVPLACYMLVVVAAAAGVGAGVFSLVAWRLWQVLAAVGGSVAAVGAVFAWNVSRTASEAERFFRQFPETVFDQADMPVGELVKISGAQVTNFYISDSNSGKRFFVRAGEGAKITSMIKPKTIDIDGDRRDTSRSFNSWLTSNNLSCDGIVRLKERFIKEGDTASVIGVLKKHHACDVVDPPAGVVSAGCQLKRCMFPILVEGLILIGNENPDEIVYMV